MTIKTFLRSLGALLRRKQTHSREVLICGFLGGLARVVPIVQPTRSKARSHVGIPQHNTTLRRGAHPRSWRLSKCECEIAWNSTFVRRPASRCPEVHPRCGNPPSKHVANYFVVRPTETGISRSEQMRLVIPSFAARVKSFPCSCRESLTNFFPLVARSFATTTLLKIARLSDYL